MVASPLHVIEHAPLEEVKQVIDRDVKREVNEVD